jgi:hypothetical protein
VPEIEINNENPAPSREYRSRSAYFLMLSFVIFTSLGAGLIFMPAGLITFGITSGLFGYLLGAD